MTGTTDFDRVLGDWLAEGPGRAPEHPIDLAVEHARSHPRRRDPFAVLRRDPMAAPGGLQLVGRPALLVALLAVLLAAVAAGALVGSQRQAPVVVPPTASPTASPPVAVPTRPVGPSPAPISSSIDLGDGRAVDVVDATGRLRTATAGDPETVQGDTEIEIVAIDATTIRIAWLGGPCDRIHRMTVSEIAIVLERPSCHGDAIPQGFAVDLSFDGPVDAAALTPSIETGRGNGLPNWTKIGPDSAGNAFRIDAYDEGGVLVGLESFSEGGAGASVEPGIVLVANESPTSLRLTWASTPCHVGVRIDVDAAVGDVVVREEACTGVSVAFDRVVVLQFDREIDAAGVSATYREVEP